MSEADNGLKLYVTTNSPFARLARIVVLEKGLESRVEQIIAKTRQANSPYYQVNPSGRVPCLVLPDGRRLEDSQLVCHYLDHLDAAPRFEPPAGDAGLEVRRLEGLARSLVEGVSVWIREGFRPPDEQSPGVIAHERERAVRLVDVWESEVGHPALQGSLGNMAQLTLITALHLERWNPDFKWRVGHPNLVKWAESLADRPSIRDTMPEG